MGRLASGGSIGVRIGADAWIPTQEADKEVFARFGGFGRFPVGAALVGGELSGIGLLTEDDLDFGGRTLLFGTVTLGLPRAPGAPELYARLPVDGDTRAMPVDATVGVRVRLGR